MAPRPENTPHCLQIAETTCSISVKSDISASDIRQASGPKTTGYTPTQVFNPRLVANNTLVSILKNSLKSVKMMTIYEKL